MASKDEFSRDLTAIRCARATMLLYSLASSRTIDSAGEVSSIPSSSDWNRFCYNRLLNYEIAMRNLISGVLFRSRRKEKREER